MLYHRKVRIFRTNPGVLDDVQLLRKGFCTKLVQHSVPSEEQQTVISQNTLLYIFTLGTNMQSNETMNFTLRKYNSK